MLRYLFFFSCFVVLGCNAVNSYKKIIFIHREGNTKVKYILKIPNDFTLKIVHVEGEERYEKQFWYNDSTVFYISDLFHNINYGNIKEDEGEYAKDFKAYCLNDTITLKGKNSNGFAWLNKRIGSVCIGYNNAPSDIKNVFDKAMQSLLIKNQQTK